MHAVDFLQAPSGESPPVVAVTGNQRHFKTEVLGRLRTMVVGEDEASLTRFTGKDVDYQTVADELRTVSMWGDQRLVIIDDADEFVTAHRSQLEKYCESPAKKAVLILDVASWPKTTRLAKQVAKSGLEVECSPLKGIELVKWLNATANDRYGVKLDRDAAALLIELIGSEPGFLDQELSKLSSYVGERKRVALEDVRGLVGGWRTETTWAMTDAIRDGRLPDALDALNQLLGDGEAPQKLLGGIGFVFRKFALATELARRMPLEQALAEAGVFPRDVGIAAGYLKRIGRARAEKIIFALITADAGMKGGSRLPERIQMERLLLQLAGPAS